MKFSNEEILKVIIASKILETYLEQNVSLREIIKDFENSDIHYGEEFVPTIHQREIFERRIKIKHMKNAGELSKVNAHALENVKTFIEKYPESNIFDVTFNCSDAHFSVWCGLFDTHIEVLCVQKGGHIPDYAFEKPIE